MSGKANPGTNKFRASVLFFAAAGLAFSGPASAAGPADLPPIVLTRIDGSINLDGLSDEPAWSRVEPMAFVMHQPRFGQAPSEKTEMLVGYDDENLYVAGRLFDSRPDRIMANSKQRDSTDPSSDWWGIILDTLNDNENAVAFFTTPAGLRWDAVVSRDAQSSQGSSPLSPSWNTFWDVAVARTDEGWFAEMRIPLSSLRIQSKDGRAVMGLISWRQVSRKNEIAVYPSIPPDWGPWSVFKPSQARKVVLENVSGRKPLYIAPYVLGGLERTFELDAPASAYRPRDTWAREAGLDLKYGLTNNLTLDLSLNTDFAQVEADDAQVNLTRFSLFFPEKRLFFQERQSVFGFEFEDPEQNLLFYSRRIGLEDGRSIPIIGGIRLTGRLGGWDVGFLNMQTAAASAAPSTNFGVLRFRRQVLNLFSYVGGILASKFGTDGSINIAYGLDGQFRLFGEDYLTLKWAQTFSDGAEFRLASLDPAKIFLKWQRRSIKGLGYALGYSRAGSDYDPEMGFEPRRDYSRLSGQVLWAWLPGDRSPIFNHWVTLAGSIFRRNSDGSVESGEINPYWTVYSKSGWSVAGGVKLSYEDVAEPFQISNRAGVPAGRYHFAAAGVMAVTPTGSSFYATFDASAGSFYDGRQLSFSVQPTWHLSSGVELSGYIQVNHIAFPARDLRYDGIVARLKALVMLDTTFSAAAFLQVDPGTDTLSANVRFRYNPREGVDLYLVYNEGWNTRRNLFLPIPPWSRGRTVMLKYTYTFNL